MARRESKRLPFTLFLVSLLLHLLVFAASSCESVWRERARPERPVKFRVVSVERKPEEKLSPDPESRFLSDANRRESGAGASAGAPRLKSEREERIPARRGAPVVAALTPPPAPSPPPPAVPPLPAALPPPPPPEPAPEPAEEPRERPKEESRASEPPPPPEKPEPPAPKPKKKPVRKKAKPGRVVKKKPVVKKRAAAKRKVEPAPAVGKKPRRRAAKKPPPKRKREVAAGKRPKKRAAARREVRPRRIETAALRPRPPAPEPEDPLAMFRVKPGPRRRGRPDAPRLDLSDEDLDRIAKRGAEEEEGAGEIISLDTRDSRYAAYFAHVRRRIYDAWIWPEEAQRFRGSLSLVFALRKDGTLGRVRLLRSTGAKILDDLAMAAIAKAAPFEPLPPTIRRAPIRIEARFSYE